VRPEQGKLVRYRLARAKESLTEAKLLLANDHVWTSRQTSRIGQLHFREVLARGAVVVFSR